MKKLILLSGILIFSYSSIAQSGMTDECVNCKGNIIIQSKYSSAIGTSNEASGQTSFASGTECIASGDYSTALGYKTVASGYASFAVGNNSKSSGYSAFSAGTNCQSLNNFSVSFGQSSLADGSRAFAAGLRAYAYGTTSFALGQYVKTDASNAFVIGQGIDTNNLLTNLNSRSLLIGFSSVKPTFFVSTSPGTYKTGKIGIGDVTSPDAKLHIKADNDENATLYLQSSDWDNRYAELQLGTKENAIKAEKNVGLTFKTEANYLFGDGNVGIGTDAPEHLLDVNGDMKVSSDSYIMGNVGIGTETPTTKLDVAGSINFTDELLHNNEPFETSKWEENGNDIYYYDGNVGIGTTNPLYDLDVDGNIGISGDIMGQNSGTSGKFKIFANTSNTNGASISLYGDSDQNSPGQIKLIPHGEGDIEFWAGGSVRIKYLITVMWELEQVHRIQN